MVINLTRVVKQPPMNPFTYINTHTHTCTQWHKSIKVANVSWDLLHLRSGLVHVPGKADEVLCGCHGDPAAPSVIIVHLRGRRAIALETASGMSQWITLNIQIYASKVKYKDSRARVSVAPRRKLRHKALGFVSSGFIGICFGQHSLTFIGSFVLVIASRLPGLI